MFTDRDIIIRRAMIKHEPIHRRRVVEPKYYERNTMWKKYEERRDTYHRTNAIGFLANLPTSPEWMEE